MTSKTWGINHCSITYALGIHLVIIVLRICTYNNVYLFEFSIQSIIRWGSEVSQSVRECGSSTRIITSSCIGRINCVDMIKSIYPRYLICVWPSHSSERAKGRFCTACIWWVKKVQSYPNLVRLKRWCNE